MISYKLYVYLFGFSVEEAIVKEHMEIAKTTDI